MNKFLLKPLVLGVMATLCYVPSDVYAQCSCTHMACEFCITAILPGVEAASDAAFEGLDQTQELMDEAIDLGQEAEGVAVDYYEQDVVSALMANANSLTTEISKASIADSTVKEAYKNKQTRLEQNELVAKQNLYIAANYGFNNISYTNKLMYSTQALKALDENGELTQTEVTLSYLLKLLHERADFFLNEMIKENPIPLGATSINMSIILESGISGGVVDAVIPEVVWPEAITIRRLMAVPSKIQKGARGVDIKQDDQLGFWRIASRSRTGAEFLAWDMALRSEVITEKGKTSLLHYLTEIVGKTYQNNQSLADTALADKRELLDSMATNLSISNLLDLLLLEVERHELNMNAAVIGFSNEKLFSPAYGVINPQIIIDAAVKKGIAE